MAVARHRERGSFSPVTGNGLFSENGTPPYAPSYSTYSNAEGELSIMDDDATPGFHRGQILGQVRCNPMQSSRETRTFGRGVVTFVKPRTVAGENRDWTFVATDMLLSSSILTKDSLPSEFPGYASLKTEVATKARSRIKSPDFQGLVSLGELRETLHYLRNPLAGAKSLADVVNKRLSRLYAEETRRQKRAYSIPSSLSGSKRRPSGLDLDDAAIIRELESIYLSVRYGMRPLVKEVSSFLETFRDRAVPRPLREVFRAKGSQFDDLSWAQDDGASGISCWSSYYATRNVTVRCGFLYSFEDRVGSTSNSWGLDLAELPSTAWALLPTSFVADWIVNVSEFISALTPVVRGDRLCEWTTIQEEIEIFRQRSGFLISDSAWSGQIVTGSVSQDKVRYVTKSRVAFVDLPGVVVKASALNTLSDVGKVLDLLSITHQQLSSAFGKGRYVAQQVARRSGRPQAAEKWFG